MGEKWPVKFSQTNATNARVLEPAAKLRQGTDGVTSRPKEGMLRIFFARKIRRLRPGLNPRSCVSAAS
jgi:hypothetical protein